MLAIDWRSGEYYLDPEKFPAGRITFEILLADQDSDPILIDWENLGQ